MKKFPYFLWRSFLFALSFAGCSTLLSSQVHSLRYWYDGDQGTLQETSVAYTAGDKAELAFDTRGLSLGVHQITMQVERGDGRFSPSTSAIFVKNSDKLISGTARIQVWIDSLASTPILKDTPHSSSILDLSILLKDLRLSKGLHTLYIQYVGSNGRLSPLVSATFVYFDLNQSGKAKIRAWVDDPEGTPIFTKEIDKTSFITPLQEIDTKGLKSGLHTLYMQYVDSNGSLSPLVSAHFVKNPLGTSLDPFVGVRYWFDNDLKTAKEQLFSTKDSKGDIRALNLSARHVSNGKHLISIALITKSGVVGQAASDSIEVTNGLPTSVQVSPLSPDPNSLIKKDLTKGAILTFYYRLEDKEHRPIEGATLKAYFGSREFVSTVSDDLGIVALEIDTESKGIKPNDSRLSIGDTVQYKFASISIGEHLLKIDNWEKEARAYTLAYKHMANSFELSMSTDLSGGLKWLSASLGGNGSLKLKYNPDGTIKEFSSNSGAKATAKIKPAAFVKEVSLYGQKVDNIKADPTPINALLAIDGLRVSGIPVLGAAGGIYVWALNKYFKKHGLNQYAPKEEDFGAQFGGAAKIHLDYMGRIEPFKIKGWVSMIDFHGIHFGGKLGLEVRPPSLNYKGSKWEDLEDHRMPYGEYKLSLKDISLTNDGIMIRSLRSLYDGNPNVFSKRLFTGSSDLQMDFSFKHSFTKSPYFRNPIELKTTYSFGIKYPFQEIVLNKWLPKKYFDENTIVGLSFKPRLIWKNSVSSSGAMLALMYQLGDEKKRRSTIPTIEDFGLWDLWGFLTCFTNQEKSMRNLWQSVQKNSKGTFNQTIEDLKEGYKISSSVELHIPVELNGFPIFYWLKLRCEAELITSFDIGTSYYHAQAQRLVRPVRYEKFDALFQLDNLGLSFGKGINDLVSYMRTSWDLYKGRIKPLENEGWDKGEKEDKDGWTYISSSNRSIDSKMLHYDLLREVSFKDKSQLIVAYKNDNSMFDRGSDVNLVSRYTAGQVYGVTAKGDSLLLIGDLFRVTAEKDGEALKKSKSPYKIKGIMGSDDLNFFGLPADTPLSLYYISISDSLSIWEPVGDLDKEHLVSNLGYYAMGCKFDSDTIPPTITVIPNFVDGYIDVKIKDNFALRSDKIGASIDYDAVDPFTLIGEMARIELTDEQLRRDSISLYVFATDVAGNSTSKLFELKNPVPNRTPIITSEDEISVRYEKEQDLLYVDITSDLVGEVAYLYDVSGALYKVLPLTDLSNKYSMMNLEDGIYVLKIGDRGCRFIKE